MFPLCQSILLYVIPALPALYDGARLWISEGWIRFVVYALCGFICCDLSVEDSIRVLSYGFFYCYKLFWGVYDWFLLLLKSKGCLEFYASEFVLVLLDSISGYVFIFAVYFSCDDMYGMFMFKGVLFFHF